MKEKKKLSEEHRKKISDAHKMKGTVPPSRRGTKLTEEQKQKLRGRISPNRGIRLSPERKKEISETSKRLGLRPPSREGKIPWNKGIKFPQVSGSKCHLWKGGITPLNQKIRTSLEYKIWRRGVFERDKYTCVWCEAKFIKGITGRVVLHADHIKPFSLYPELRFALDNGRTLCVDCHRKTDTYANKVKKYER